MQPPDRRPSPLKQASPLLSPKRNHHTRMEVDETAVFQSSPTSRGALAELLKSITIGEAMKASSSVSGLLWARADERVGMVCKTMADNLIRSMPVFSTAEPAQLVGIVDFADVASHVVTYTRSHQTHIILTDGQDFVSEVGDKSVLDVIDLSHRNPTVPLPASASLLEAIDAFVRHSPRPRQLVITTTANAEIHLGDLVGIMPPSLLLKAIQEATRSRSMLSGQPFTASVSSLGLGTTPVITIDKTQTVLEAFDVMFHHRITGVAVIDDNHALVGNISMSDIRHLFKKKRFATLIKSCWQFIVDSRAESLDETFPFYAVRESSSVADVMDKALATHVHHLFVVDSKLTPIRVISLGDVLSVIGGAE